MLYRTKEVKGKSENKAVPDFHVDSGLCAKTPQFFLTSYNSLVHCSLNRVLIVMGEATLLCSLQDHQSCHQHNADVLIYL